MRNASFERRASRIFALVPVLLAILVAAVHGGGQDDPDARLAAALEEIRAEALAADLHFLASDEMRGRDTPSPELEVAARFVRARLQRLGIAPGAREGYMHVYPLVARRLDPEASGLCFEGGGVRHELAFGEDYFFSSTRGLFPLSVETDAIFCGEGTRADFSEAKVEGRWAVCFNSAGFSRSRRVRNAESAKAAGLIVLPRPSSGADPFAERYGDLARVATRGTVAYPSPRTLARMKESGFPETLLSADAGRKLLEACAARGDKAPEDWEPRAGTVLGVVVKEERVGPGLLEVENVCGYWRGSDPKLSKEVIILSAHYDHEGTRGGTVYPGADDNGSGSVGLLAVAEALRRYGPMRRSILLLWVSGEEKGLFGSRAWAADPWLPDDGRAVCNVNLDMIGRNDPAELLLTPTTAHRANNFLSHLVIELAPLEGFTKLQSADSFWSRSDHASFHDRLEIPVAFLFTGIHEDYTRPTDTPDKIDYDKIRRVCRLVMRMLHRMQEDELGG